MGFDAGHVVEPLEWTFEPFVDGAKGTIADPSDKAVRTFFATLQKVREDALAAIKDAAEDEGEGEGEVEARAERVDREQLDGRMLDALTELCSGSPSREQIEALPVRQQLAFVDWLTRELVDPTKAAATRPLLAAVK